MPNKSVANIKPVGGIGDFEFRIKDQQQFPICTGMAAYIQEYWQAQETGEYKELSPMFVYKLNKLHDGLPPGTEGSTAKASMDTLRIFGVCREILYPLNSSNYTGQVQGGEVMKDAEVNKILAYTRNPSLDEILISLDEGKPVGFSMFLLSDFYTKAVRGRVPKEVGGSFIGGHFMVACWYDLDQEVVKVVQSWGTGSPTLNGYMEIPFTWFRFLVRRPAPVGAGSEDYLFPLLMDSYTPLDYVPPKELVLPKYVTVGDRVPTIEVNGQPIQTSDRVFAFIGKELGRTMVTVRTIEEILRVMTGKPAEVKFDENTWTVKISL
jgi:hypothetical protein